MAIFFSTAPVPPSQIDEYVKLQEFKKKLPGLYLDFDNVDDLGKKLYQQLDSWAGDSSATKQPCVGLRPEMASPGEYMAWLEHWNPGQEKCTLLLYNVELGTFADADLFQQHWGALHQKDFVEKIVFLLPNYKLRRFIDYVGAYQDQFLASDGQNRFFVCELGGAVVGKDRVTTSTGFCMLRRGANPASGEPFLGARIFSLTEPFCKPNYTRKPEIIWDYKYSFIANDENLVAELLNIWDDGFNSEKTQSLDSLLSEKISDPAQIDSLLDKKLAPTDSKVLKKIERLRDKLFDPNVPSYLMDHEFFILDWNPAFEMVFPTETIYRRQHVKDFVDCLANKNEVIARGIKYQTKKIEPSFDLETLLYKSPKYGSMTFTKQASKVDGLDDDGESGWIVALNVTHVEHLTEYNEDLKTVNERNSLTTAYARPYNRIITQFPAYLELVDKHAGAMKNAARILEIGCGPGVLTEKLLSMSKQVTAVDNNDAMLEILRRRCGGSANLSIVKANAETLHSPNPDYPFEKIGITPKFDGLVMMNVLFSLNNPVNTLKKIRDELLADGCVVALSLPAAGSNLDSLLTEIQNFGQQKKITDGKKPWSNGDYEALAKVNRFMDSSGILTRYSENAPQILEQAGFTITSIEENVYAGQGIFITARK